MSHTYNKRAAVLILEGCRRVVFHISHIISRNRLRENWIYLLVRAVFDKSLEVEPSKRMEL